MICNGLLLEHMCTPTAVTAVKKIKDKLVNHPERGWFSFWGKKKTNNLTETQYSSLYE